MLWFSLIDRALDMLELETSELQLTSAEALLRRHYPSLSPDRPALIGELNGPRLGQELRARLAQVYPESHEVTLLAGLDTDLPAAQKMPLGRLERTIDGSVSLLYLPPLACPGAVETFQATVAHLRAPGGCPWDRKQTHQSLRTGFLEEAYEVIDALDRGDLELLKEELGDVLLHVLLQAQIASEEGEFSMSDVVCHVNQKIVYRHPHVFDGLSVDGVDEVLDNWEALKRNEKGRDRAPKSLFDGIPHALPALARTRALLRRARRVEHGHLASGARSRQVDQTLKRLETERDGARQEQLLGDLLFDLTAFAAGLGVDAEGALRDANARFEQRVIEAAGEQPAAEQLASRSQVDGVPAEGASQN